ncbi:MAG: 30S ribosomal protein S17e [Candidatus Aenigmarchaeota archaeon]|nr:30S ribosomal protein S17e [Candidatus Aenigmarchaeota archaeon]
MGRIKSTAIRTLGEDVLKQHPGKFGKDFEKNKKALAALKKIKSKRTRNKLAGFITRKMTGAKPEE